MKRQMIVLFLLAVAVCFSGCGPDTGGRQKISGTVLFGGVPMKTGSISFQPVGEVISSAGADIVDGQFQITAIQGLIPGEYSVVFACQEPTGKKIKQVDADGKPCELDELVSYVPDDYARTTTQRVTVVKGKNVFKFDVPRSDTPVEAPKETNATIF